MNLRIALKVVAVETGNGRPIGEAEWREVPDDVEPDTLLSYLEHRVGRKIDIALTRVATDPALPVGWIFQPPDGPELLVIPFLKLPDGTDVAMFEYQAREEAAFRRLPAEGQVDRLHILEQPQREYKPTEPH